MSNVDLPSREIIQNKPKIGSKKSRNQQILDYIFHFQPGDSLFHLLHPVTKIIWFIAMTISILLIKSLILLSCTLVLIIFLSISSGLGVKRLTKKIRWIILFTTFSMFIGVIFNATLPGEDQILFYIWFPSIPIRRLILYYSLRVVLWVLSLSTCGVIFLNSTSPQDIAYGIRVLGHSYKAGYSFMIGLRYVPLIEDSTTSVKISQQARGLDLRKSKSIKKGFEMLRDRLTTSLILIFRSASYTSISMELRGFGKYNDRTNLYSVKVHIRDFIFLLLFVILFILILGIQYHWFSFIPPIPSLYSLLF
jgi:energy-coupling factor transport system permease protein